MKTYFSFGVVMLLGLATSQTQAQNIPGDSWNAPASLEGVYQNVVFTDELQYPPYPQSVRPTTVVRQHAPAYSGEPASVRAVPLRKQDDAPKTDPNGKPPEEKVVQPIPAPCQTQSGVPYFYGGNASSFPQIRDTGCAASPSQSQKVRKSKRWLRNGWSGHQPVNSESVVGAQPCGQANCGSRSGVAAWGNTNRGYQTHNDCGNDVCGNDVCGNEGCGSSSQWFGGVGALIFFRDDADDVWLSYPNGSPGVRSLTTRSVDADPFAGVEATVGKHLCNGNSWAFSYWGLFGDQNAWQYDTGDPEVALPTLDRLDYNGGTVDTFMNAAVAHRVRRQNDFHNFEWNLFRRSCCQSFNGCSNRRIDLLAGVRYLNFNDDFQFATSYDAANFGANINDMYYDINTENHLYGVQMGGIGHYPLSTRLSLRAGTKVGVFGNHINHYQRLYGGLGNATVNTGASAGQEYSVSSNKDDIAFLGEIDLGLRYAINQCWNLSCGYRAVGISGVAHTTDQIPNNFADLAGVNQIDSNGGLILHGVYIGAEFNY